MVNIPELRAWMARRGYTQKELAGVVGLSEKTMVNRFRTGKFSVEEAGNIARALEMDNAAAVFFGHE